MAAKILVEFSRATNWLEIGDERDKVLALKPFTTMLGGVSTKFSAEFSGAGRYNLIFARSALDPAGRRTEAFFDRKRYYPLLPEYGGAPIKSEPVKG